MSKEDFRRLFLSSVREALAYAEAKVGRTFPSELEIELHGGGVAGKIVPLDEVIDTMYLSEDQFYPIIDIGVKAVRDAKARVFVRISPGPPCDFEHTWNSPRGNGPI